MVKEKKSTFVNNLSDKDKTHSHKKNPLLHFVAYLSTGSIIGVMVLIVLGVYNFEKTYQDRIYPGVRIDGVLFGGKKPIEVEQAFDNKSQQFKQLSITLSFEDKIATLSGNELAVSYDSKLSSVQAYSIGRSNHLLSDIYQKWKAATSGINLTSLLKLNTDLVDEMLTNLASDIDIETEDALFQFEKNKVTLFRPSKTGRSLNIKQTKNMIQSFITTLTQQDIPNPQNITLILPVESILPNITTENSNEFGIKELIGSGRSKFVGSIPQRVHNIELAASKINGRLVQPGAVFSFNEALGDVSATTGFQPAYIIKEGRTVLGDGGGVCQVSTTLFRAALSTGLPIVERHAHAYRVSYYEQDSSPGLDATVYAPGYDLKFKNDTSHYLLIQAKTDKQNSSLTFEIYGTNDGRKAEISKPVILSQTPPPADLFQDEPTLPRGVVKQVDWKAWGAKVNFEYKVFRNGEIINQQTFFSNFQPWQAIFLRGTKD